MTNIEKMDEQARRATARVLIEIFNQYKRTDFSANTKKGALKALATRAVQEAAINTLADLPVWCPDRPSKAEAARIVKRLLEFPNNLSRGKINEALALVDKLKTDRQLKVASGPRWIQ